MPNKVIKPYIPGFTSNWSPLTQIGDQCAGGYYIGQMMSGTTPFAIIVAPKASSSNGGATLQYKTTNTAAPGAASDASNGSPASDAMSDPDGLQYPAARYCRSLSANGYSDWYLPARDELELLYRILKPDTTLNYVMPKWMASNAPVSENTVYAATSPSQTGIMVFRSGGQEAFDPYGYWCSTDAGEYDAWRQSFGDGTQSKISKTTSAYVRAIRRVDTTIVKWEFIDEH